MQPSAEIQQDNERVSVRILEKLGQTLRASFEATTEEPIPQDMALLLLRIAFAQALEKMADEEARVNDQARSQKERIAFPLPSIWRPRRLIRAQQKAWSFWGPAKIHCE